MAILFALVILVCLPLFYFEGIFWYSARIQDYELMRGFSEYASSLSDFGLLTSYLSAIISGGALGFIYPKRTDREKKLFVSFLIFILLLSIVSLLAFHLNSAEILKFFYIKPSLAAKPGNQYSNILGWLNNFIKEFILLLGIALGLKNNP